jgi:dephospho-CoA kinase
VTIMIVALTGGLGAGKSTVSALLAEHGAVIVDADVIARDVVQAGTPGFAAVLGAFGDFIVGPDGQLDRPALAQIVFGADEARARLNAIVHPLVAARSAQLIAAAPAGAIVVNDIPLLSESRRAGFELVIVVLAELEVRLSRLETRGMTREQSLARIAVQASDEERLAMADEVVRNDGDRDALAAQVDALWGRLVARSQS